jgi:hypothetical protein
MSDPENPENPENPKDQEQEDSEEQQEQDLEEQDQTSQVVAEGEQRVEETVVLPLLPQLSLPSSMRKSSRVKEAKRNLSIAPDDMKTLVQRAQQRLRGEDRSTSEMRKKVEKRLKNEKELYEAKLALLPLAIEVEQLKDTYKAALKKRKKR